MLMRDRALDQSQVLSRRPQVLAIVAAAIAAAALGGASAMWLHYGTSVFFATVAAGIAACF
jgi:hypothetical protein